MKFRHQLPLLTAICLLLVSGCTTPPPAKQVAPQYTPLEQIEKRLQQAETAAPIAAAQLKVEAGTELLQLGLRERAFNVFESIDIALLPPVLRFEVAKLLAESALEKQQPERALGYLDTLPDSDRPLLPQNLKIELFDLQAKAYQAQNDHLNEINALINQSLASQDPEFRQVLHNRIWERLIQFKPQQLEQILQQNNSYYLQGWLELSLSLLTNRQLDTQYQAFNQWGQLWQSHPAVTLPPEKLSLLSTEKFSAARIAVLLPESGGLLKVATAIKEGLLLAHYENTQTGQPSAELHFLDEALINSPEQLSAVVSEREIDFVIGPLTKDKVTLLADASQVEAPVMALNYSDTATSSNLYQFGLSIEDEAHQTAEKIWADGHRQVATITPDSNWGLRINQAFIKKFEELGGEIVNQAYFGKNEFFAKDISELLNTDISRYRFNQIRQKLSSQKLVFEEQKRSDIDAFFLSALPRDARQLKPILAFNFAGTLPVYATSHIYSGTPDPQQDQDLNGVRFCATPWTDTPPLTEKIILRQQRTDADSRFGRLYALGIDAYKLYPYLQQLSISPGTEIKGTTGYLSVTTDNKVQRRLNWKRFRDGIAN